MVLTTSWLADQPAMTHVVNRQRTADTRAELAHAVIDQSGPPDWVRGVRGEHEAYDRAVEIAARVGTDPDVLLEALLWDDVIQGWCWSEGHERCCEDGNDHAHDAWREAVAAICDGRARPPWFPAKVYWRLRKWAERADRRGEWPGTIGDRVEHDDDLNEACDNEGVARHMIDCPRGTVGGDFHSTP